MSDPNAKWIYNEVVHAVTKALRRQRVEKDERRAVVPGVSVRQFPVPR